MSSSTEPVGQRDDEREPEHARIALCIEQTLGHRALGMRLQAVAERYHERVDVFAIDSRSAGRPLLPWAVRASLAARRALGARRYDAALLHTQTVALFAPLSARGSAYVLGVDATPVQFDEMAEQYRHRIHLPPLEWAKGAWYRAVFRRAAALVAMSQWAATSLVEDYGVDPARIHVLHPGAPAPFFEIARPEPPARPTILFVGEGFERKGGHVLLEAFAPLAERAELVLVTPGPVPHTPGVRVLADVRPGTAEHLEVFRRASIFCLPTLADCTPLVIGEAMAAGLPVVSTTVASSPEWVGPDAGILVPPGDVGALRAALVRLVDDPALAARMGSAGRAFARSSMSAERTAEAILDILRGVADARR